LLKNSKLKAVVCETGHKSPSVCLYLRGHGIEHAKSVLGGTSSLGCLPTFWRN
jgi:rhodanese-related sulfurtransferase